MTAADRLYDYSVIAFNTSAASDNKIHDDAVASKLGFKGGLVPGVDVYAYMVHPVMEAFGVDFLERGTLSARFMTPVYDGLETSVKFDPSTGEVIVESAGILCASGQASLPETKAAIPDLADYPITEPPAERPEASDESMVAGQIFGSETIEVTEEGHLNYLKAIRETSSFYQDEKIIHAGYLLRRANRALTLNVELGPWIHVGSEVAHFGPARVGETLSTRSIVTANYEQKGHKFVDLDVFVLTSDDRPVVRIQHKSIYVPRQLREAAS